MFVSNYPSGNQQPFLYYKPLSADLHGFNLFLTRKSGREECECGREALKTIKSCFSLANPIKGVQITKKGFSWRMPTDKVDPKLSSIKPESSFPSLPSSDVMRRLA